MNAIQSGADFFSKQTRIIGALMMRELATRFGRQGLGFAIGQQLRHSRAGVAVPLHAFHAARPGQAGAGVDDQGAIA